MKWDDTSETDRRSGPQGRGVVRNVIDGDEQRHRLSIYRAGLARMRGERQVGVPPVQTAWRVACHLAATFALDTHDSGLLVGCLVAARES